MKKLALDTNAYSALEGGNVTLAHMVRGASSIGLAIIVLGELYFGFEHGSRKSWNAARLEKFVASTRVDVL